MNELIRKVLKPERVVHALTPNLATILPDAERSDHYDRLALGYDLLVGNSLYNRLIWGNWVSDYTETAQRALTKMGEGPILDCGCGSLIFTAKPYAAAPIDRMILFDRSQGMLRRGMKRLPSGQFLQGDALDMPFDDGAFSGIMSWGFLHVLGSGSALIGELRRILSPRGKLVLSTLILSDRAVSNRWLSMLEGRGEAVVESRDAILTAIEAHFTIDIARQKGAMLVVEATPLTK